MVTSLVGVVILLGGLIFFHELGHYSVAKFFGVRVEVFSLGFGKKIFRRKWGETEYTLSLIPLGGYVKLMGDDPYKGVPAEDAERAFSTQKLYKRFLIVAAGPLSNLLLAYFLFTVVFFVGQPTLGTKIGSVAMNSVAWKSGFRAKDKILEVGGNKVASWNEFEEQIRPKEGQSVEVLVDRAGTSLKIPVVLEKVRAKNPYGEDILVGGIKGINPNPFQPVVGVSDTKSVAYLAGLRTGDQITKIAGTTILTLDEIDDVLKAKWQQGGTLDISFKRKASPEAKEATDQSLTLTLPKSTPTGSFANALGMHSVELFIMEVTPDSPAEKAGLKSGDRIAQIGNESIFDFERVIELVQELGGKGEPVILHVEREGETKLLTITPNQTTVEDPLTRAEIKKFMVGMRPTIHLAESEVVTLQVREPFTLVRKAVSETNLLAKRMVVSLWKLAFGQISVKNLGGPVLIASVAGKSLDAGIIPFLQMMALISINLFLLNLFPVPILDGGHLLFFTIEGIKGKPVSVKTMEFANQVGMAIIMMLVAVTLFNDITRIIKH